MITREHLYFINLRQAYFLSPLYASRISSRTVLFTVVPEKLLNEARIRRIYGDDKVKNVWISTDVSELDELVNDRDKAAFKLEGAETKLIKLANAARVKAENGNQNSEEDPVISPTDGDAIDGESGSVAAKWIAASDRPTHRLKPIVGKKVDTINWARSEIERLTPEINAQQAKHRAGDVKRISAIFVEFYNQTEAQAAYQMRMPPFFSWYL